MAYEKSRRTYNGVHLNKKSNTQDVVEQSLTLQPTAVDLPRSYVADIQAIQFVEIKAKVEGFVQQVLVDEGQLVKKVSPCSA